MVLPVTSPWSATAFRVASGMVFTVLGATRPVTYRVSGSEGSFTPVDAHSGRCTFAPCACRRAQRSEENISSNTS